VIRFDGRVLRRALVLALLAIPVVIGLGVASEPASAACPRPAPPVAAQRATAVFTGVVASAAPSGTSFVQVVTVDRLYKGQVITAEVRVRTTGGKCGLGQLTQGERYVVFATPDGDSWLAGPRSGTSPATDALLARVQAVLGQGTAPAAGPSAPPDVTYTRVGAAHPGPLLRTAAPGIALVIVGLLGLLVTRRWGRAAA
jgi:hypothetical protein